MKADYGYHFAYIRCREKLEISPKKYFFTAVELQRISCENPLCAIFYAIY